MSFVAGAKIPSQQQQFVLDARQARQCAGREARQGARQSNGASPAIRDGGSGETTISAINRGGGWGLWRYVITESPSDQPNQVGTRRAALALQFLLVPGA